MDSANLLARYISQVRQELAIRLLARVYAGGSTPSKVSGELSIQHLVTGLTYFLVRFLVVVKFYEAEIYGKIVVMKFCRITCYPSSNL